MGVVKRQSFKATMISYVGVAIAYLTLTVLFPMYLSESQIGLHRVIIQAGLVFSVVGAFGVPQTVVRFYSFFMRQQAENSLFGMLLTVPLVGLLIFMLLFYGFKPEILGFFAEKAPEIEQYYPLSLWIMLFFTYYLVLAAYAQVFQRIVVPKLFLDVIIRLLTLFALFLFVSQIIDFDGFLNLQPVIYGIMALGVLIYVLLLRHPGFRFDLHRQKKRLLKMMFSFSAYSLFTSASGLFIIAIDSFMVTGMLGLAELGIYSIAFYMGQIIEMPKRAVVQMAAPIVSKAWFEKDWATILRLYQKTAANLMILGGLFFLLVWLNLPDFYLLMPNGHIYNQGLMVVFFIALARFIDMSAGANFEIIANSQYYFYNLIIFSILFFVTIASNYLLIPIYGISGAAMATLISLVVYNLIGFLFIWLRMGIQPYNIKNLYILLVLGGAFGISILFTPNWHPLLRIVTRSILIGALTIGPVLFFNLSNELDDAWQKGLKFIKNKIGLN
jgi:O-antigen/teichoic acid export membrane protein